MFQYIISLCVIGLVYVCLFILIFSPTLYAFWFYLIGNKVRLKKKSLLRIALTTFVINAVIAFFLVHLAFDYFLTAKVAEKDALAAQSLESALTAEKKFYRVHGRYYAVGPVRGPYRDDHGLTVQQGVILAVEPRWDKAKNREVLDAYALHVLGNNLLTGTEDGKVKRVTDKSPVFDKLRKKLMRSVQ